ncbi:MAG TPA: amidohydrolase family protein [Usitatibacter sp.]
MNRRSFLAAMGATTLAGCSEFSFEQGLFNECRDPGAGNLSQHPIVQEAWKGLQADQVWDVHVHLFGSGRGEDGVWLSRTFDQGLVLADRARHAFFMNAACAGDDPAHLNEHIVTRLAHQMDQFPSGAKAVLLAFDFTYDENGKRNEDLTTFSISNDYAQRVAKARPDRFEWTASVHPYRPDVVEAIAAAKAGGARAVKWLPPSMGIDLSSPRCNAAYDAMMKNDMPLLVHMGEEKAVPGAHRGDLANPLLLRTPLERGVRMIVAHCASLGTSPDLETGDGRSIVPNLDLFARLMSNPQYDKQLSGDISAITQANRGGIVTKILAHREWQGRLLNGSDYPLPGVMPLFSMRALVAEGVLDPARVSFLHELRQGNALLFDFVLKRSLASQGQSFQPSVFETRRYFERRA